MGIRIASISVKDCGPIGKLDGVLGDVNLIYGKNESGKSFLVEFLIKSLFRGCDVWNYLRSGGEGKVVVEGIEEKPIEFSPKQGKKKQQKKIEHYIESDQTGLPSSFARLLVVKEGDFQIDPERDIDRDTIKEIFSARRILDSINQEIQDTIKKATVGEGFIEINKQGEGKRYYEAREELERIDEAIERASSEYGEGEIQQLSLNRDDLSKTKNLLISAKRFRAFTLSNEIARLEDEIAKIPDEMVDEIGALLGEYSRLSEQAKILEADLSRIRSQTRDLPLLEEKRKKLLHAKRHQAYLFSKQIEAWEKVLDGIPEDGLNTIEIRLPRYFELKDEEEKKNRAVVECEKECADLDWLRSAKESYSTLLQAKAKPILATNLLFWIALALWATGILTMLVLLRRGLAMVLLSLSATFSLIYGYLAGKLPSPISREIEAIKDEFRRRFGVELRDPATLDSLLQQKNRIAGELTARKDELEKIRREMGEKRVRIEESFGKMGLVDLSESDWWKSLDELKKRRREALEEIKKAEDSLARLDVAEDEYEEVGTDVEFSKTEFEEVDSRYKRLMELRNEEERKEQTIEEIKIKLDTLRSQIGECFRRITDQDVRESEWKKVLEKLKEDNERRKRERDKKQGELNGLGVKESEYLDSDPGISFSQAKLDEIERELQKIDREIAERESSLTELKGDLCRIADVTFDTPWSELLSAIYKRKAEKEEELAQIEANIIAGKILHDTIMEFYEEEDQKVEERINSSDIAALVFKLTGRYKRLSFDESELVISDNHNDFHFKDLSTGAKEQVMLALRVGFASKALGHRTGFLILDDALQHSDYERRPILIDSLFDLAGQGWQVIYLTMDDHIRDLFREKSTLKKVSFKEINL